MLFVMQLILVMAAASKQPEGWTPTYQRFPDGWSPRFSVSWTISDTCLAQQSKHQKHDRL
jgi:hypothetical protein